MFCTNVTNLNHGGGRFIPPRKNFQESSYKIRQPYEALIRKSLFDQDPHTCYREIFNKILWRAMFMNENKRILNFSVNNSKNDKNSYGKKVKSTISPIDWPVYPRKNPLILKNPDDVFRLDRHVTLVENEIHWASNGNIYILDENMVWVFETSERGMNENVVSTGIRGQGVLRCDNLSNCIAVSIEHFIYIWCLKTNKLQATIKCCFFRILSLCWDKSDRFLISGCLDGHVAVWDTKNSYKNNAPKFRYLKRITEHAKAKAHYKGVVKIFLNADDTLVCSLSIDNRIRIWSFPDLKPKLELISGNHIAEFHPWKPNILATGDMYLTIWDVAQMEEINECPDMAIIDCLTWSPLSGELVVCITTAKENEATSHSIIVISSLSKVVDRIVLHYTTSIYCALWSPDGTTLATIDTSENLTFWKFFGTEEEYYKKRAARRTEKPPSKLQLGQSIR